MSFSCEKCFLSYFFDNLLPSVFFLVPLSAGILCSEHLAFSFLLLQNQLSPFHLPSIFQFHIDLLNIVISSFVFLDSFFFHYHFMRNHLNITSRNLSHRNPQDSLRISIHSLHKFVFKYIFYILWFLWFYFLHNYYMYIYYIYRRDYCCYRRKLLTFNIQISSSV